jgi:hypothetical protein
MQKLTLNAETLRGLGVESDDTAAAEEASICWFVSCILPSSTEPVEEPVEEPVCACPPVTNPPQ